MELLDRYLQAVRKHLPWQRQDDIIAELRANLEAQLEDKETELGRPLTQQGAEEWLKQIGSPIQVAARYQRQQYLIGPALFPTYSYILRLVLTWLTVIYAIATAVNIVASHQGGGAVLQAALRLPWMWLTNAAIVTLIFALIELSRARFPEKFRELGAISGPMSNTWSPLDLPPVGAGEEEWDKPRSFTRALLEVFAGGLFLGYILLVPHYPFLLFGPGAWYLRGLPYHARSCVVHVLLGGGLNERLRVGLEAGRPCSRSVAKAPKSRTAPGHACALYHPVVGIAPGPKPPAVPA